MSRAFLRSRTQIPILSHIVISTSIDRGFSLKSSDMTRQAEATFSEGVKIAAEQALAVPGHILLDIVSRLPEGCEIEMRYREQDGRLIISSGRANFELATLKAEDFPDFEQASGAKEVFDIKSADLFRLLDKVRPTIADGGARPFLEGAFLHAVKTGDGFNLRAVASDGHRLARVDTDCPRGAETLIVEARTGASKGVIIPKKTVVIMLKLLKDFKGAVTVEIVPDHQIRFTLGDLTLGSKVLAYQFPDYTRLIPPFATNNNVVEIETEVFAKALGRCVRLASDETRFVTLTLDEGSLEISASGSEYGSAQEGIAVNTEAENPALEIGFNAKYLTEFGFGETFIARFSDNHSAAIFLDPEDEGVLFIVMPAKA